MDFSPGQSIGPYLLRSTCGRGAYGTVFIAENRVSHAQVALKVLPLLGQATERELKGLQNYRDCRHPSLLHIDHIDTLEGYLYYTMDLADNLAREPGAYLPDTLANRLHLSAPRPVEEITGMAMQLLDGLEYLHERHLLHRDIKPDNIFWVDHHAILGDIGLLTRDSTASFAGTRGFISPAVLSGQRNYLPEDDFYALGKVLYCALTGCDPRQFPHYPQELPLPTAGNIMRAYSVACQSDQPIHTASDFRALLQSSALQPQWSSRFEQQIQTTVVLTRHAFLRTAAAADRQAYLDAFALLFIPLGEISLPQENYLDALGRCFGASGALDRLRRQLSASSAIDAVRLLDFLKPPSRHLPWLIDALYLGSLVKGGVDKVRGILLRLARHWQVPANELSSLLDQGVALVTSEHPGELYQAIHALHERTDAWQTILEGRGFTLRGAFDALQARLNDLFTSSDSLPLAIETATMAVDLSGEMLLAEDPRPPAEVTLDKRRACQKEYAEIRGQVDDYDTELTDAFSEANEVFTTFGLPVFELPIDFLHLESDDNYDLSNDQWGMHLCQDYDRFADHVGKVSRDLPEVIAQLKRCDKPLEIRN